MLWRKIKLESTLFMENAVQGAVAILRQLEDQTHAKSGTVKSIRMNTCLLVGLAS